MSKIFIKNPLYYSIQGIIKSLHYTTGNGRVLIRYFYYVFPGSVFLLFKLTFIIVYISSLHSFLSKTVEAEGVEWWSLLSLPKFLIPSVSSLPSQFQLPSTHTDGRSGPREVTTSVVTRTSMPDECTSRSIDSLGKR